MTLLPRLLVIVVGSVFLAPLLVIVGAFDALRAAVRWMLYPGWMR